MMLSINISHSSVISLKLVISFLNSQAEFSLDANQCNIVGSCYGVVDFLLKSSYLCIEIRVCRHVTGTTGHIWFWYMPGHLENLCLELAPV